MKGKNDTMAKRILENGEIKDKKKINKSRIAGMTLIALVVTIIVIIILATVGITIGLGSGGVIEKAEVSKDIVKLSEYGTTIKMITANEYTNKMSNEKTGELKELVKNTLKKDEKWVKDVEDVKGDENKIKVITVEDYIIVAQIWDDGDLDIINAGKDNEEPYPVISIGQEVVDENTIKLKVIADVTTTDKTKGIDTVTFVNTGDAIKNYNKGDVLTFNVTKSGKYTFEAVTNMGKTTRQSVVVKIKSSEADIQIASEPTTSRNTLKTGKLNGVDAGPIEVNIDYGYTKLLKQYKLGEDGTWTNVDSQNVKLKVTDNMTVYARYFDGESKEVKLTSYDVANVDNIAPNAFGITATSTSNSITVNASTIDTANKGAKVGISGVKEYLYRIFRNESWGEWQSSKQFTDLPEGEYKVQAKAIDKAGNETISSNVVTLECKLQRAEVTFDNNDGSDKKQTVSKVVGTELGELPTVSREGYDFAGWYTDKTSGTRVTENTVVPETDVTYYARWTARNDTKYTVIHQQMNLDGTTYTTVDTEELKGKTDSKVTPDVKSYEGFTAPEKQEVTIKADGSTTVTYKYTRNKYTLTYNPNGGSVSPTSIKADYDEEITLPTPTRKYTITYNTNGGSSVTNSTVDYTFNGWYTKASEGDKRTYTKMPAYNETLYAQWASSGIALPTTNKAGYVLAGWYTDSALTSEVTLSDGKYIPTANITLYAKWEEVVITLNPMSFTYDGTEKKPETTVKVGSKIFEKDKDYTVEYKNNINVGTATVTITGKGSYEGVTATTTFKINEKRITIPAGKTLTYNGEEQIGVDSKAEYKLNGTIKATNAKTYSATATLTDTANTKWSDGTTEVKTISWKINAKNLSGNVTVSDVEDKTYTGSAITPEVEVNDTARNTVLTKNTDYTISYKNNVNAGTATIIITGKGNYTGTVEKTFKINGDENPIKVTNKNVYTGSTIDLSTLVSDAQGDVTFEIKTNGTTTASTLAGSKLTAGAMSTTDDKDQTIVITAKAAGNGNYNPGSKEITITVQKYTPTLAWTSTTPSSIVYGTTGKTATVTATVSGGTKGAVTYTSGTTGVLTINSSTGALTTAGVGSSTITASIARTTTVKAGSIARTISVTKATNPITVTGNTLTYNGKAQNLVTTAKAQGAVYYSVGTSLTSSNYTTAGSTTIPTQTSANTSGYVVYYYCVGNGNYNAKSGNVTVKIAKAASVNPTLTDVSVPYDTKAHAISVSGGSGGTIYYRTSTDNSTWGSWTTTKPTRTSVGTTYVQAYVKGDSNHSDTSATASKKITIQTSYWKNTTKGTYYATTASAISAAAANDTLELQRNFTDAGTVSINKTLYIDLSSYTWTKTTSTITITSAGMVYLGADKGKITTSGAFNLITNAGKFYLGGPNTFSGSLTRTNASSDYSVVYNTGTYSQASTSTVITSTGIGIYNNGGDVSIQTGTIDANYHAIKNHAGTLEINGGGVTITGNKGTDVTWSAVCNDEGATMTLKSGTITGSNHQGISNYGTCTISGGTVKSGKASNAITNQSTGKVTITGGTISTTTGYAIRSLSTQTAAVSVSGGTVTSSTTNGTILNEASGTVTLSGGTIENTNLNQGDVVPTIRNTSTGKIKIDGATVKTGGYGVYNTGAGAVELSSGSIGYSGSTPKYIGNVGIYTTGTGKITMSGGSITSMEDGINSKGNSITISKGTISAKYTGVKMLGSSLVISGQSSTTTIESGDIGVSATKNVNITITGGSIKGTNYGIQRNTVISGNTTLGTLNIGTISSTSENNPLIYGGTAIQSNTAVNCYSGLVSGAGLCITGSTITVGGATTNKTNSPTIILRGNASSTKPVISTSGGITYYSGRIGATGGTYVKVDDDTKTPIMFKCFGWTNKSKSSISYNSMPAANAPTITVNGTKYSMTPYNSLTYTK